MLRKHATVSDDWDKSKFGAGILAVKEIIVHALPAKDELSEKSSALSEMPFAVARYYDPYHPEGDPSYGFM